MSAIVPKIKKNKTSGHIRKMFLLRIKRQFFLPIWKPRREEPLPGFRFGNITWNQSSSISRFSILNILFLSFPQIQNCLSLLHYFSNGDEGSRSSICGYSLASRSCGAGFWWDRCRIRWGLRHAPVRRSVRSGCPCSRQIASWHWNHQGSRCTGIWWRLHRCSGPPQGNSPIVKFSGVE